MEYFHPLNEKWIGKRNTTPKFLYHHFLSLSALLEPMIDEVICLVAENRRRYKHGKKHLC
jgi:hypothetical protein